MTIVEVLNLELGREVLFLFCMLVSLEESVLDVKVSDILCYSPKDWPEPFPTVSFISKLNSWSAFMKYTCSICPCQLPWELFLEITVEEVKKTDEKTESFICQCLPF